MVSEYVQDSHDSSHIAAGLFLHTLSLLTVEAYVVTLCVWVLQLTHLQQPLQSPFLFGHEMGTRKLGASTLFIMKLLMLRILVGHQAKLHLPCFVAWWLLCQLPPGCKQHAGCVDSLRKHHHQQC